MIVKFEIEELIVVADLDAFRANRAGRDAAGFDDEDETFRESLRVARRVRLHLSEERSECGTAGSEHDALGEFST